MRTATANRLLDRALIAYSYLPHHPGKGKIYESSFPLIGSSWDRARLRKRFGVWFECDLTDKVTRAIYYTGFDRRDCRASRRLLKPGSTVLDIGANVGYFSLLFAHWMKGTGTVHAFEPFPGTAAKFKRNLDLNPRLKSVVRLHELGLADFTGSVSMSVPDEHNSGCNFLEADESGKIQVTTLDQFVKSQRLDKLDFIKIDVEGSEVSLIQGAEETLRRFRPVLMIEINPSTLQRYGKTSADLVELLGRHRYRLCSATRFGSLKSLDRLPVYGEEPNVFAFPID